MTTPPTPLPREISGPQLQELRKRTESYSRLALIVDATAKALENTETISAEEFRAKAGAEITRLAAQGKDKDIWAIFNTILKKPEEELFKPGQTTALVAVEVGGRVLEVRLNKIPGIENQYDVTVGQFLIDRSTGVLASKPIGGAVPTRVFSEVKPGNPPQTRIGATDPSTGIRVYDTQFINRPHQIDAILKAVGEHLTNGEILPLAPSPVIRPAQLMVAGTGSGKTGILASAATVHGVGIFAVPKSLVSETFDDLQHFIFDKTTVVLPEKDIKTTADFEAFLAAHANDHIVMSHEQLTRFAGSLRERNIFLDEVHELTASEESRTALAQLAQNNVVLGVTATPTTALYDTLGAPVFNLSLYEAQHVLKTVRQVKTEHKSVAAAALAAGAITQLLTRSGVVDSTMKKFDPDPARSEKNVRLSSQTKGMIFTDDPVIARQIHDLLSGLSTNPALRARLNETATRDRAANGITGATDVYAEVFAKQRQNIESNIQIEILAALNPKIRAQDLQQKVRSGLGDEVARQYQEAMKGGITEEQKAIVRQKLTSTNPILQDYYESAMQYFAASTSEDRNRIIGDLQGRNGVSVLLTNESTSEEIARARALFGKGLVSHIVSSGPLGTGYSDKNTLSTVRVQAHPIVQGSAAKAMQEDGRSVRDSEGLSFGSTLVDESLPEDQRNLTSPQVFSSDALEQYNKHLVLEARVTLAAVEAPKVAPPPAPSVVAVEAPKESSPQLWVQHAVEEKGFLAREKKAEDVVERVVPPPPMS